MKLLIGFCFAVGLIVLLVFALRRHTPVAVPVVNTTHAVTYLPLGDSYTIGQSISEDQRWPNQLAAKLQADGVDVGIVTNPSVTGYTTQNLIDRELPLLESLRPNFVTILIGVNDYVQGVPQATFTKNLQLILDTVQRSVAKNRIVLVTIPDYGKTPTGAKYGDPAESTKAIKSFNDVIAAEATVRGLLAVDIYGISQGVTADASLTASDGLHPSGKQYGLWTDAIYNAITTAKLFK